jgi:hypothetical protein
MSHILQTIKAFIDDIPIEDTISEQNCISSFTELCKIKKRPGQDSFFEVIKILNLSDVACKTKWEISENPIGEVSENGTIYKGTCNGDGDNKVDKYALKYIVLKGKTSYELKNISNEINLQQQIYKHTGYTTPIHQIFLNENYMMFITDKLGTTVYRYLLQKLDKGKLNDKDIEIINKIIQYCYEILHNLMYDHGIIHGDEHLNNFMLTEDFNEEKFDISNVKIIDFGKSYRLDTTRNNKVTLSMRLDIIKSIIGSNINDIRFHKNCPSHASILLPKSLR